MPTRDPRAYGDKRPVTEWMHSFGAGFTPFLAGLGPDDLIFDWGSGNAIALKQYQTSASIPGIHLPPIDQRAKGIAFSVERAAPSEFDEQLDLSRFQEVYGHLFESIKDSDLAKLEGKVSLIVSLMGVGSYLSANDFAPQLQRVLKAFYSCWKETLPAPSGCQNWFLWRH